MTNVKPLFSGLKQSRPFTKGKKMKIGTKSEGCGRMIHPSRLKEIRALANEPGTLALLDMDKYASTLRRILDKGLFVELCDEVERLTIINDALESDLINARLNLERSDNLLSDIPAINHCLERIRAIAYGGGLLEQGRYR